MQQRFQDIYVRNRVNIYNALSNKDVLAVTLSISEHSLILISGVHLLTFCHLNAMSSGRAEPIRLNAITAIHATIWQDLLAVQRLFQKVLEGSLFLHGWYFNMECGELLSYKQEANRFEPVVPPFSLNFAAGLQEPVWPPRD